MPYQEYKHSFKNQFRTMASLTVYRTGRQQCGASASRGQEVRDFYLIHYVIKGAGVYTLNGISYPVKAGETFLIYPNMPINYVADDQDPWEYCWVGFNGTDARILLNATRFSPQTPVITPSNPDRMLELLLDIYVARGNLPHEIITMTARLYSLLAFLIEDSAGVLPRARPFWRGACAACLRLYRRPLYHVPLRGGCSFASGGLPQSALPHFQAAYGYVTPKVSHRIPYTASVQPDVQTLAIRQGSGLFRRF